MKVSELSGVQLDWAVAKCEGIEVRLVEGVVEGVLVDALGLQFSPSIDWSYGGMVIEREKIDVCWCKKWFAWAKTKFDGPSDEEPELRKEGPTPLIAAMRCYAASKLGDEIELPEELK